MDRVCFVSVDVEQDFGKAGFQGVENLDRILALFEKKHVPATLFVTGRVLQKYSEAAREWSKHYEIACHGFSHTFWNELSGEQRKQELEQFKTLYQNIFGQPPKGFRGPSHIIDELALGLLQEQGFLYDSSVVPHYPFFKKYRGYQGRAPLSPYYPAETRSRAGLPENGSRAKARMKILEIPLSGQLFGLPLAGAWFTKLPLFVYKILFEINKPDFITLSCHSWDILSHHFLNKLDKILSLLCQQNYQFLGGKEIYELFSKDKK